MTHTVALFADRCILPGLHATLASALDHADPGVPLRVIVFADGLTAHDRVVLEQTVQPRLSGHRFEIRDFGTSVPRDWKSLRGNYTAYGRLFLPVLVPDAEVCVYLDADLVVTCSLAPLFAMAATGRALYAEGSGRRADSIDQAVFRAWGLDMSLPYFNSGVLVINLERWRREGLVEQCRTLATQLGDRLLAADQTLLNVRFGEEFGAFGSEFNTLLWPTARSLDAASQSGRILHFVGAPKPWNRLGRLANSHFDLWDTWVRRSAWCSDWRSRATTWTSVGQALRFGPATVRALRAQYRSKWGARALERP